MKRTARWFWILALLVPAAAGAGAMTTTFQAQMFVNGTQVSLTDEGRFRIPSALLALGWSCRITPEDLSDDTRQTYRNIACSLGESSVSATAACLRSSLDHDSGAFSVRAKGVDMALVIVCNTVTAGAPP
jgi:hypothetical protein